MASQNKILIGIPTKDRDVYLGNTLCSLAEQSFQRFDILIMKDGDQEVGSTPITRLMLDEHSRMRKVVVMEGEHKGPPWNHNIALYHPLFREYEYIARKDDDLYWDRHALREMYFTLKNHPGIAAVGGLWFEEEAGDDIHDRKIFWSQQEFEQSIYIRPEVGPYNSNWPQRVYHPTDLLYNTGHVYSDCLYRAKAMREVGGWPECYTRGVAHCEETDGTYRLYLAGWELAINPKAHGQHIRASGGIRTSSADLHAKQLQDLQKWQARLPILGEMNFEPTVVVECAHQHGIGGAARLFYHTVSLLQSRFGRDHVAPHFTGLHYSPEECEELFGFSYWPNDPPHEADVGIVIGHEPLHTLRAKHLLYYCLFPKDNMSEEERLAINDYDAVLGISDYSSHWVQECHKVEADTIYPPVPAEKCWQPAKEDLILVVSRCVPQKAPLWLMQRFVEMNLPDYRLEVVASCSMVDYRQYEQSVQAFADAHENISVRWDISHDEVSDLYQRAKVLWIASGMAGEETPSMAEHFGYTPIEAWACNCVPVVFDRGGFRETVADPLRWTTKEELFSITRHVLDEWKVDWGVRDEFLVMDEDPDPVFFMPVDLDDFSPDRYVEQWSDWVLRAHAGCLDLQRIVGPEVLNRPIRVAMISDSPYVGDMGVTSGFGQVAGQVAKAFLEEGFELYVYGLYDKSMPKRSDGLQYDYWPGAIDLTGSSMIPAYVQWSEADVIFMLHAPGELWHWQQQLQNMGLKKPTIAYFPVEGAHRLNASIPHLIETTEFPVTYCHSGADLIRRSVNKSVLVAYHGVDHAPFEPYPQERRDELRELLGWKDKFVLMTVGTNKRVKNMPCLVDAMRHLLGSGHKDIILYMHTKQFDQFTLQGWSLGNIIDLDQGATGLPLKDHIIFPEDYDKWQGVDYAGRNVEAWKYAAPSEEYRRRILNSLDLVTRYNLADLYVDVSSAEGWGMPVLEAVMCGIPAVSVDDGMVRSEVHSRYCHMLKPKHWDTWHTGTMLALVDSIEVASKIVTLKEDSVMRNKFAEAGARIREDLPWKETTDLFVDLVRKGYALSRRTG